MRLSASASRYGPDVSAIGSLALIAAVELICSFNIDNPSGPYFAARFASGAFMIAAMLHAWNIARSQRRTERRDER